MTTQSTTPETQTAEKGKNMNQVDESQEPAGVNVESPRPALANCPFCGEIPHVTHGSWTTSVRCSNKQCECSGVSFLIAFWNTRPSAWQPIETAPKDGTRVLFYTPECKETGWLAFIAESFYDKHGLNDIHVAQWQDGLEPTHWMPSPAAPDAAITSAEGNGEKR